MHERGLRTESNQTIDLRNILEGKKVDAGDASKAVRDDTYRRRTRFDLAPDEGADLCAMGLVKQYVSQRLRGRRVQRIPALPHISRASARYEFEKPIADSVYL